MKKLDLTPEQMKARKREQIAERNRRYKQRLGLVTIIVDVPAIKEQPVRAAIKAALL